MNTGMANRPASQPSLASLFISFARIGLSAFGGGLAAWTRREIVQRRGWMDDTGFLSGYGLSQLVPGATNVNLSVFIGTQLRGLPGAVACFLGLIAPGLLIVVVAGFLYFRSQGGPNGAWVGGALAGMGAVAIGLNLGTGIRLGRRNLKGAIPLAITAIIAISIGLLGYSLVDVLAVMMPVSLLFAWLTRPR